MRKKAFPGQDVTLESHREQLVATKGLVEEWARQSGGSRDLEAAAMLQLLSDVSDDIDGDSTLEIASDIFEQFVDLMSPVLAHQIGTLCKSAHELGRSRCVPHP